MDPGQQPTTSDLRDFSRKVKQATKRQERRSTATEVEETSAAALVRQEEILAPSGIVGLLQKGDRLLVAPHEPEHPGVLHPGFPSARGVTEFWEEDFTW